MEELSALVAAAQRGDAPSFGRLVERFQGMAYASAYARLGDSHLAEDVAQEAFFDAYLSLGNLREPAAFPGWFRRFVIKHSDRQYRAQPPRALDLGIIQAMPSDWPDPAVLFERGQERQSVRDAIAALPSAQREATLLFYIEGYSQKEIAAFVGAPLGAVKKRLFDARKSLEKRMLDMVTEDLKKERSTLQLADKVEFFIALREHDMKAIRALVKKNPELVHVKTEWTVASEGYFWPINHTATSWAAANGSVELLEFLLEQGVDINEGEPLRMAINMGEVDIARLMLERGADPGGYKLCIAAIRNEREIIELLVDAGGLVDFRDGSGRTPADWAQLKGHDELVEFLVERGAKKPKVLRREKSRWVQTKGCAAPSAVSALGRVIDGDGHAIDGRDTLTDDLCVTSLRGTNTGSTVLETGIKIVDFCAPIRRGGHVGVFTPLAGVGKGVVLSEIFQSIWNVHDGCLVYAGLEEGAYTAENQRMSWRHDFGMTESLLGERVVRVFAQASDSEEKKRRAAETARALAEDLRRQGREVLLVIENQLALVEGVIPLMRANISITPEAAVTTLYVGHHTVGAEPIEFTGLDTLISFDLARAHQGLYPAVDPLVSSSALLVVSHYDTEHRRLAEEARKLLLRYEGLHAQYERHGFDALFFLDEPTEDERVVLRARRLHRFLTQPFMITEPWTAVPGESVSLSETLKGVREILEGRHDEVPEEAFHFKGELAQVLEKASASA